MSLRAQLASLTTALDSLQRMSVKLRRLVVSRDAVLSEAEVIELLGIGRGPGRDLLVALGVVLPLRLIELDAEKDREPRRKHDVGRIVWGDVVDALRARARPGAPVLQAQKPRRVPRDQAW